jgi:hypothetical protein
VPYLCQTDRNQLDPAVDALAAKVRDFGEGWGDDVYHIIRRLVYLAHPQRYAHWQEVIGALVCAKMELNRTQAYKYNLDPGTDDIVFSTYGRRLNPDIEALAGRMNALGCGWGADLNYVLHVLVAKAHPTGAEHWRRVRDTLENTVALIYSEDIGPYEDAKMLENGPVF